MSPFRRVVRAARVCPALIAGTAGVLTRIDDKSRWQPCFCEAQSPSKSNPPKWKAPLKAEVRTPVAEVKTLVQQFDGYIEDNPEWAQKVGSKKLNDWRNAMQRIQTEQDSLRSQLASRRINLERIQEWITEFGSTTLVGKFWTLSRQVVRQLPEGLRPEDSAASDPQTQKLLALLSVWLEHHPKYKLKLRACQLLATLELLDGIVIENSGLFLQALGAKKDTTHTTSDTL